jgi:DNA-binding transcriptional regulator YbjK
MAPPRNVQRRDALAGAAIEILGTAGIHKLSHRSVDEQAGLPHGTAANYFPTRDDLLAAAARRVAGLHLAEMTAASRPAAGRADRGTLAELIGASLYDSATRHRTRYLAIFELTLEATRRPGLARSMAELGAAALETTIAEHRALGLATSPQQVQVLITLFGGTLLTLVTGPPEAVTRDGALALSRAMVTGALGAPGDAPAAAARARIEPRRKQERIDG